MPESQSQSNLYSCNSTNSINSDDQRDVEVRSPIEACIQIDDDEEASLSESDAFFQPEADQSRIIEMNNIALRP